jgi:uncharacterized protein (DUF302 family)
MRSPYFNVCTQAVWRLSTGNGSFDAIGFMPPTELLILGNPNAGTPILASARSSAIDLPLKVAAWTDEQGQTRVAFNDPEYLQRRHGFAPDLAKNIAGLEPLVTHAVGDDE